MKIQLKYKIDDELIKIMHDLYEPFLPDTFKTGHILYHTILDNRKPIGYVNATKTMYLHFALFPEYQRKNVFSIVMHEKLPTNIQRYLRMQETIHYTVHIANYPFLKLLKKLNGGVSGYRDHMVLGYFEYVGPKETFHPKKEDSERLDMVIKKSKPLYEKWLIKKFKPQYERMRSKIEEYQKSFVK